MSNDSLSSQLSEVPWRLVVCVLLVGVAAIWWLSRPPVKLDDNQYATTIALYRICNQRSDAGLDQIELLLEASLEESGQVDAAVKAMQRIIEDGREGHWQQATADCRLLLDSQVKR
ncbi:hypothetical protein FF011L_11620 [Roseimaritima multifibrata]|uniref:Uncharacterized protein n=1 Tax=Roseimaritima multifibrata TaxID=1930274 RepID=A0A517MC01_9BACT|nr:hypothetical protein [Roseimaritima multifibrata]QDS92419.1 hypothetical protein FF011L_11620 [Roseimaritima multifibrata]